MRTRQLALLWLIGTSLLGLLVAARFIFNDALTRRSTAGTVATTPRAAAPTLPAMRQPQQLRALPRIGAPIDAVFLERSPVARDRFTATLLRRDQLGSYHRTTTNVTIQWRNRAAPMQMGNAANLKITAVLQVVGQVEPNRTVLARSVTVLTGFVNLD
jgi:hypothetical protein